MNMLPGALRSLPTDAARAEGELQALVGDGNAQVNFGMERAVVLYDPDLVTTDRRIASQPAAGRSRS